MQRANIRDNFRRLIYRNPLYKYTLIGKTPKKLLGTPPEVLPGNPANGQLILSGILTTAGQKNSLDDISNLPKNSSRKWKNELHSFYWLSDLRAVGNDQSRNVARKHILKWLNAYSNWSPVAWDIEPLGRRLSNWITHFGFFIKGADQEFYDVFFLGVIKQARHLNRCVLKTRNGPHRIRGLKGLICCGVSLPAYDHFLRNGIKLLQNELEKQIHPDGGHHSRCPQIHMEVLKDLIAIRETLIAAHIDISPRLNDTIARMAPILKTYRHADGGLALFNGSTAGNPEMINTLLLKSGVKTHAVLSATHSGFHRLAAGRTIILIDTGVPPSHAQNKWAHSGTLAFEMSSLKDRIIVNCGMTPNATREWRHALRSTAAHSTITIDDVNSSQISIQGGYGSNPGHVTTSRREIGGSSIIEASYDGYMDLFGLIHRRLIMLAPNGAEIQGEDNLIGTGQHTYSLRFHLHPNVQSTVLQDTCSALLKPRRGPGWRFSCIDQSITIEESVYFDGNNNRRRTQQIVITGSMIKSNTAIKWRIAQI